MANTQTDTSSKRAARNESAKAAKKAAGKAASSPDADSGKGFMLAIGAILVIGLAALAYVATNREGSNLDAPQSAPVEIDGTPLPQIPGPGVSADPATDGAIGMDFPTISGTGFDDEVIEISNDGRAKVVYFLAHWCPHCQVEVPLITELIDDGRKPADLDIYGISTSLDASRGNYPPVRWLDNEGFEPPVMRDSNLSEVYQFAGAGGFPYAVYVGPDNKIIARSSGSLDGPTIASLWTLTASAQPAGS